MFTNGYISECHDPETAGCDVEPSEAGDAMAWGRLNSKVKLKGTPPIPALSITCKQCRAAELELDSAPRYRGTWWGGFASDFQTLGVLVERGAMTAPTELAASRPAARLPR